EIIPEYLTYHFYIVAPTLNNYHYLLFSIHHDIPSYPVTISVGEEMGDEIGAKKDYVTKQVDDDESEVYEILNTSSKTMSALAAGLRSVTSPRLKRYIVTADSEEEFIAHLQKILQSNKTIQVLTSLLAQLRVHSVPA
ncbi:MAG: hypothetical protein AAF639_45650, partial [Chloroflexota bacterium]